MAVNRLGEYLRQDPQTAAFLANLQQQAAAANTGTHLGGLSSLVNKLTRGYVMGQDKGKRRALSKALTSSPSTPTKIIPGSAGQIDPGVSEAEIFAAPEEYDSIRPSSGKYLTKPVAARIDPQSGPIYGRTQALKNLLLEDPDNQYASRALLSNQDQLAARNDALKLAQINSANKLATLQATRMYDANQQQATRDNAVTVAETAEMNLNKREEIKADAKYDKFGTAKKVVDSDSPTGHSWIATNARGVKQNQGPAPAPSVPKYYDPRAYEKKTTFQMATKRYDDATGSIEAAQGLQGDIQQMNNLVVQAGSSATGALADAKLKFKKLANAVGIDVDLTKVATIEALRAKSLDFVLRKVQMTKGAISNREMSTFEKASAGTANTQLGNLMILAQIDRANKRLIAVSEKLRDAYGKGERDPYKLDMVKKKAYEDFGSIVPDRRAVAANAGLDWRTGKPLASTTPNVKNIPNDLVPAGAS